MQANAKDALPTLLTTEYVAEWFDITPQSLRRLRMTGGGPPFIKLGRSPSSPVRYRRADVEVWLTSNRAEALREVRGNWKKTA
jgi:hypothetical protein